MKKRKISWIIAVVVIYIACGVVMAITIPTWTIANSATVHTPRGNITAYLDEACTQPLNEIDWKHIDEGIEHSKTFWIKNEGDDEVCAEWHDDIEEVRDERDDSDMKYYNETRDYWVWWSEEYRFVFPATTPTPTLNATATTKAKPIPPIPIPPISGPYLEPGEKLKVRYTIEFKISPIINESYIPKECKWNLTLGY